MKMVIKEKLVHLERKALKETRVPWVLQDLWELEDLQVIKEHLVHLETRDLLGKWGDKALKERMDLWDCSVLQDRLGHKVFITCQLE